MSYEMDREWYACVMALAWALMHRPSEELIAAAHSDRDDVTQLRMSAHDASEARALEANPGAWLLHLKPDARNRLIVHIKDKYGEPARAAAQEAATEFSRMAGGGIVQ